MESDLVEVDGGLSWGLEEEHGAKSERKTRRDR